MPPDRFCNGDCALFQDSLKTQSEEERVYHTTPVPLYAAKSRGSSDLERAENGLQVSSDLTTLSPPSRQSKSRYETDLCGALNGCGFLAATNLQTRCCFRNRPSVLTCTPFVEAR